MTNEVIGKMIGKILACYMLYGTNWDRVKKK